MADLRPSQIPAGGKDDLQIDASRCLQMRFSESSCRRCAEVCLHRALTLDGLLSVNPNHCKGCLLCTAVCPSGALEQSGDFSACLAQLSRVPEPILGCMRSKESSNATLACLGGLSEEHLAALCCSLSGKLTLNLSACSDCPSKAIIPQLQQRLDAVAAAGLLDSGCRIVLAETAKDVSYRDESVDRRSFFKAFRNSVFKSAAVILSTSTEQAERRREYVGKRVPIRRELLKRIRNKVSEEAEVRIGRHFDVCISFDDACTTCQGCVAICPLGALRTGSPDSPPNFDRLLCSGCGLCAEFCLDGALRISADKP